MNASISSMGVGEEVCERVDCEGRKYCVVRTRLRQWDGGLRLALAGWLSVPRVKQARYQRKQKVEEECSSGGIIVAGAWTETDMEGRSASMSH